MRKAVTIFMLTAVLILGVSIVTPQSAHAQTTLADDINKQNQKLAESGGYGKVAQDPRIIAANIIRIFLGFLGIIFMLYTIYGGWLILNSRGVSEHIENGKKIIRNGAIGVVVILSAYGVAALTAQIISNAQRDPFEDVEFRSYTQDSLEDIHNRDRLDQDIVPFRPRILENL